jgi:hypothetical protein
VYRSTAKVFSGPFVAVIPGLILHVRRGLGQIID